MSGTRRYALKMLGTVGATCAFPFAGDELYGQHAAHPPAADVPNAGIYEPAFFTRAEYGLVSVLADTIIPATDTSGASEAGVPEYIDRVVSRNPEHQILARTGLTWLAGQAQARFGRAFDVLAETDRIALLQPLSDHVDRQRHEALAARFRIEEQGRRTYYVATTDRTVSLRTSTAPRARAASDPAMPMEFFRLFKNLTVDGYYTSRVGLLDELRYQGNAVLGRFPPCTVPEQ